jgi:hypothetical protein
MPESASDVKNSALLPVFPDQPVSQQVALNFKPDVGSGDFGRNIDGFVSGVIDIFSETGRDEMEGTSFTSNDDAIL